jgi:hypothetical protein
MGDLGQLPEDQRAADDGASPPKGTKMRKRINGPYAHFRKWRVFVIENGKRTFIDFDDADLARKEVAKLKREAARTNGLLTTEVLERYEAHLVEKDNRPDGILSTRSSWCSGGCSSSRSRR